MLILVAALAAQTRARPLVIALVVPLVFLAAVNNYGVFKQARAFALQNRHISPSTSATAADEARRMGYPGVTAMQAIPATTSPIPAH